MQPFDEIVIVNLDKHKSTKFITLLKTVEKDF